MGLREYKAKRDFRQTKEPVGARHSNSARKQEHSFVIQKHAARRLHYDFRLEMEGVLKSWAVPKGLPLRKGEKHLAIHVEDHPLDYGDFEGTIPEGNYGAGQVIVWDRGTYAVIDDNPMHALKSGKIHLHLSGEKLEGEWILVKTHFRGDSEQDQWLILKSGSDAASLSTKDEDRSVLSARSLDGKSDGISIEKKEPVSTRRKTPKAKAPGKVSTTAPLFVPPMKCLLVDKLPKGPEWIYEIKFDGVRALTIKNDSKISMISRNAKDVTAKYPEIARTLKNLPCRQVLLDGEVVALDPEGRSSFQLLQSQNMELPGKKAPVFYYVFDILHLNGKDLTSLPLMERKEILRSLLEKAEPPILFSAPIESDPNLLVKELRHRGLEGLIAKQRDSRYEIDQRSGAWVKFKWTLEQEFLIGGYTPPKGARTHFGALLVGYYERGKLLFASKVGTGFDQKILEDLLRRFQKLVVKECPFSNLPEKNLNRSGQGMTASRMRECIWLKPKLVCQIRFSEWTRDGHLRQPVYLGLREDKKPEDVVRERPRKSKQ